MKSQLRLGTKNKVSSLRGLKTLCWKLRYEGICALLGICLEVYIRVLFNNLELLLYIKSFERISDGVTDGVWGLN